MPRPRLCRRIGFNPNITYFKPQGVPMRFLDVVELTAEEVEALRLKNSKNLNQAEAAKMMKTSRSTFQRILISAYKKFTEALIKGKAIKIINLPKQKYNINNPISKFKTELASTSASSVQAKQYGPGTRN